MINDLINKYNIGSRYVNEISCYLAKFIDNTYLMDINADVLSRMDLDNINIIFENTPNVCGIYQFILPQSANTIRFLDPSKPSLNYNMSDDDYYREYLVITAVDEIKSMMERENTNVLGINKLVYEIGGLLNIYDPKIELIPFSEIDKNLDYKIAIKSEIRFNKMIQREYNRRETISEILNDDEKSKI